MLIEPHNKCIQGCCTSTFVNSLGYSALGGHEVAPAGTLSNPPQFCSSPVNINDPNMKWGVSIFISYVPFKEDISKDKGPKTVPECLYSVNQVFQDHGQFL